MKHPCKHTGSRGQALVEFCMVLPLLLLLIFAIFDYGFYWTARIDDAQAARDAVRYAAVHPSAWSNSSSPPSNTIQGIILAQIVAPNSIANNDTDIQITYWDTLANPYQECGYYSQSSGAFVAESGYTENSCLQTYNEIIVTVHTVYIPLTPGASQLLGNPPPGGFPITESAGILEEQS